MLIISFTSKSLTKFLTVLLFASFTLPTSNAMKEIISRSNMLEELKVNELSPVVYSAADALHKLMSYYKLWYRITRAITRKKSQVCLLNIERRRRLCAQVFRSLVSDLENAKINDILGFVVDPKPCQKEVIRTPKDDGGIWKSKKTMIFCRSFNYPKEFYTKYGLVPVMATVPGIHVSAARKKNAVFVFVRNSETDNLEIYRYIENLIFEQEDVSELTKVERT